MKMFRELFFSPRLNWTDWLLFQALAQKGKGCMFLENLTEETVSCYLCIFLWLCLHMHTFDFSYFEWNSKGKRPGILLFCPSSSVDFSCIPFTVMLHEYKGSISQSCDWHSAAFPLCWARREWPGQEEVPISTGNNFPFPPLCPELILTPLSLGQLIADLGCFSLFHVC